VENNVALSSLLPKVDEYRRVKVNPVAIFGQKDYEKKVGSHGAHPLVQSV
jgi:hypothetical protein